MEESKRKPSMLDKMAEKSKYKLPEKENILKNLEKLKEAIKYIERIVNNENYKPLSQNSIDKLSSFPQAQCINDAFINSIAEKLKVLVEKNKEKFDTDFQTSILNYCILIYCKIDGAIEAITFDISEQPPVLKSTTYSMDKIEKYIDYFPQGMQGLNNKKNILIGKWQQELMKLTALKLDKKNFKKHIDENYIGKDRYEEKPCVSNIDKQEEKLGKIKAEIDNIEKDIEKYTKKQKQAEYLENISKNVNLDDFIKLTDLLEQTLGINLESKSTRKIPIAHPENGTEKSETYEIGEKGCKIKYIKKIKTFKNL